MNIFESPCVSRLLICVCLLLEIFLNFLPIFQIFIIQSAVPPPEASTPRCFSLQAIAFTAALCRFFMIAKRVFGEKTIMELSLLPTAKYSPSGDHFNPQISCLGPLNSMGVELAHLKSCSKSLLSLDPVKIRLLKMEIAPTRS